MPVMPAPPPQSAPAPQPIPQAAPPPQYQPVQQAQPQYPQYPPAAPGQPGGVYPPQPPNQNYPRPYNASPAREPSYQYGSQSTSAIHIWGPFAGYGTRRRHVGWLLDNQGEKAGALAQQVDTRFRDRQVPLAEQFRTFLTGRGLVVENRPYYILRRGLASTGLYIGQFGKDLYISLASYLKPPISYLRVLLVAMMTGFWLYMTFFYTRVLNNAMNGVSSELFGGSSASTDTLINMLCIVGPLGLVNSLALLLFVIFSVYKWFTEKDILAGLRTTPNEFNEDDMMAMEKTVESTVRMSMDDIGLNPADLKPAAIEPRGRLI